MDLTDPDPQHWMYDMFIFFSNYLSKMEVILTLYCIWNI
jgi:hypothetical protein